LLKILLDHKKALGKLSFIGIEAFLRDFGSASAENKISKKGTEPVRLKSAPKAHKIVSPKAIDSGFTILLQKRT